MTEDELAALEQLTEAATLGPWMWEKYSDHVYGDSQGLDGLAYDITRDEDRAFIAAARTAVPALIAEVRRLRATLADYRHQCSECDAVELCLPSGYDWHWTCADSEACRARFEAKYPLAYAE